MNSGTQVSTTVLGPEQKMPDGNLQLCVMDSFLFGFRLKPVTEIYHIVLLVLCFIKNCCHLLSPISVMEACSIQTRETLMISQQWALLSRGWRLPFPKLFTSGLSQVAKGSCLVVSLTSEFSLKCGRILQVTHFWAAWWRYHVQGWSFE